MNPKPRNHVDSKKVSNLPLSDKKVYIDTKNGKHFQIMEDQLVKLGAVSSI